MSFQYVQKAACLTNQGPTPVSYSLQQRDEGFEGPPN